MDERPHGRMKMAICKQILPHSPQKELTPLFWTHSLQNCETVNFSVTQASLFPDIIIKIAVFLCFPIPMPISLNLIFDTMESAETIG